jgi:hypothetical protein
MGTPKNQPGRGTDAQILPVRSGLVPVAERAIHSSERLRAAVRAMVRTIRAKTIAGAGDVLT